MLNHTYTSVNNANLVDCGKKQRIPSQPTSLLKDNFLGEFRTELDKKKVLANLGIATELSLEWEYIKGDIGRSQALMQELDSRTKYTSLIDGYQKTLAQGITYLESIVGGEEEAEEEQNIKIAAIETKAKQLDESLTSLSQYLQNTVEVNINELNTAIDDITEKVDNITELIKVSTKEGNALILLTAEDVEDGQIPGLYVPDLSQQVTEAAQQIVQLQTDVTNVQNSLDDFEQEVQESLEDFVTREELGGDDFNFVNQTAFDSYKTQTNSQISNIQQELSQTVKTGEDGHVDTLFVNKISKNNDDGNIVITDSFKVDSNIPLDIRFVKENLQELYSIPAKVCYPGMGVIVNSLSALYILRKPAEGQTITQDYIANANNWKCPEDLVTIALTRQDYESLEEINPNVFYYVYEDEITRTKEPTREEYLTEEEFQIEWQKWTESLKTLSQEYMSAAWGVDIENKLGKKASSQSVSILLAEINNIKGNGSGPSLESLNNSVQELINKDIELSERTDEILVKAGDAEVGRIVDLENEVTSVKNNLQNYVTKEFIQDDSNEFIFVKNLEYQKDKEDFEHSLQEQVSTKEVLTQALRLQGTPISIDDNKLKIAESIIASVDDVPNIEILTQEEYDDRDKDGSLEEGVYYYTYGGDDLYVTKNDLDRETSRMQKQINVLFQGGTSEDIEGALDTIFLPINVWEAFQTEYQRLVELVNNLEHRLSKIEPIDFEDTEDSIIITGDPERCYVQDDALVIKSDSLTLE